MTIEQDKRRIRKVLADFGIGIDSSQAEELWRYYSEGLFAVWLGLPETDEGLLKEIIGVAKGEISFMYKSETPQIINIIKDKLKVDYK
ncbi:hypothetical protein [Candidatus Enterococcus courvalinii]|uniref:Uncharacterized protein n=1 Tax=Candidatus Enterococcus courvalinii TaxID=2815329 RepID=A0ABS3I134_9ENTE|nr:hypothetical protein [Enterococcus sp. MSG2901]MBO0481486.1 hypothetical protein [Enterococcus sp. MSG2901]